MAHVYDFYKPAGPFPRVDGRLSVACYLEALGTCYERLAAKLARGKPGSETPSLADFDFCIMHVRTST